METELLLDAYRKDCRVSHVRKNGPDLFRAILADERSTKKEVVFKERLVQKESFAEISPRV